MPNVSLITYSGSLVTPQHDALMNDAELSGNGMFFGGNVTPAEGSSTSLAISHGIGAVYGREFEITGQSVTVERAASGSLLGRVYIEIDLNNQTVPIDLKVVTGTELPALIDNPDINVQSGLTQMELATFTVDTSGITGVTQTAPQITRAPDAIAGVLAEVTSANASLADLRGRTQVTNVTASTDLNTYTSQGVYYFGVSYAPTHRPTGNTNGFLCVLNQGTMTKQIWLRTGSVGTNDTETYIRTGQSGTWSAWDRVLTRRGRIVEDHVISNLKSLTWTKANGLYYSSDITPTNDFTRIESITIYNWGVLDGLIVPYIHGTKVALMSMSNTFTTSSNLSIRIVGD